MVIDTSVFVAAFRPREPDHVPSRALVGRAGAGALPLFAPAIIVPEAAAAFARGASDAAIGRRYARRLLTERLVTLSPVTKQLAARAADIAADHGLRGCDSIFVALAEQLGEELVTLDRDQLSRGAAVVATRRP